MDVEATADCIARHARASPDALAVLNQGTPVTWQELNRHVLAVSAALPLFGIGIGSRVALLCPDAYLHWVLVLACERQGAVSEALTDLPNEDWSTLQTRSDRLLTTAVLPVQTACPAYLLPTNWLQRLPDGQPGATPAVPDDAPARVARSSGTTGRARRMVLTRRDMALRAGSWQTLLGLHTSSRYLVTMQMSTSSACYQASACARAGAALVLAPPVHGAAVLQPLGVTHLFCLPGLLEQWLATRPSDSPRPAALQIFCGGARVTPLLRQRTWQRLGANITEVYASNEAGITASAPPGLAAGMRLHPRCQAEVVDAHDRVLPHGQQGRIRLRSPSMVHTYLDGPDPADEFHDGWFYPGDLGAMPDAQHLRVTGRATDLMNLGGVKVHPETIESALVSEQVPAHEIAVCSLPDDQGVEEVWVAVSGRAAEHRARVQQALQPVCRTYWWVRFHVVQVASVTPLGAPKLSRQALRDMLAKQRG